MQHFLRTYRYELIAALSGGVVMMLELVGARMVAPYFGTSIYVWTAMIGVILGSLSVGYWYGGKLADAEANDRMLAGIVSLAAVLIGISIIIQEPLLGAIARSPVDLRLQAVAAALVLFAPASCLLGIVSPYVVKLKLSSLATAGSSVGRLYAAGTAGSIVGTFATGYWLIAWFGNYTLGLCLVLLLIGISFIAHLSVRRWQRLAIAVIAAVALAVPVALPYGFVADIDSAYSRYRVSEFTSGGVTVRKLLTDNRSAQAGYVVGRPDELLFEYLQGFQRVANAYGPIQDSLMIGGGTYTFPSILAQQQPRATIDTVEIDPRLDAIARDYFGFRQSKNLHLIHQDGRVFLNQNTRSYDLVFIDAFSSLSPPYQLTTIEAAQAMKRAAVTDGLVVANVIARPDSSDGYFTATYHTYDQVFDTLKVYRVQLGLQADSRQNLLFVMGSGAAMERIAEPLSSLAEVARPTKSLILRDDHAPVDQLINSARL